MFEQRFSVPKWYLAVGENVGLAYVGLGLTMLTMLVVAVLDGEYYAIPGVVISAALAIGVGTVLRRVFETEDEPAEAAVFASAAAIWLFSAVVGMLPFLTVAWTASIDPSFVPVPATATDPTLLAFRKPVNAWFESMSGFTGSGLTMVRKESELPTTLQWWRSLIQWLGGLGVIVLTIAIVNQSGEQNMLNHYYQTRTPLGQFQSSDRSNTPQLIVAVFGVTTLLSTALFWAVGMPAWDSINHAMTGLATGGFVVTDTSFKAYESTAIRLAALPVMFVGAIPLPAYYFLYKLDLSSVYRDVQVKWLFGLVVAGSAAVALNLHFGVADLSYGPLVDGAFQFVSAISCTGFYTVSSLGQKWPSFSVLLLTLAMVVGGASGSTASGIKIIRGHTILRGLRTFVRGPFPDEHLGEDLDDQISGEYSSANYRKATFITFLYVLVFLLGLGALVVLLPRTTPVQSILFTVASAQSNVGMVSGIVTPSSPVLGAGVKVVLTLNMWAGRVEIIPVLVFLRALFWSVE